LIENDINVPGEIAVVGFDDFAWATRLRPALAVVSQPIYDLGRQTAELLLRRIGGEHFPARQVVLPTTLKVRGSSQRCQGRDPGP
jgi:LacI family transcriptional regulator, galactose operon repressor